MSRFWFWLAVGILSSANLFVWSQVNGASLQPTLYTPPIVTPVSAVPNPEPIIQQRAAIPDKASIFVPILMYHYIRDYTDQTDPLGIQLSVSPAKFAYQLSVLQKAGYHTISLMDFVNHNYGEKPIILTFDDGYDDHFTAAFPILKQFGMTGTFFIVKDFVGRKGYMTRDQISEMASSGMEIGAHTLDHKDLSTLPYTEMLRQIQGSLYQTQPVFAYPSGKYNPTTIDIVNSVGIKVSVTTNLGVATDVSPIQELPRIRVKSTTDILKVILEEINVAKKIILPSQVEINPVK